MGEYAQSSCSRSGDKVRQTFIHEHSLNTSFHMSHNQPCPLPRPTIAAPLQLPSACITDNDLSPSQSLQHRDQPISQRNCLTRCQVKTNMV